MSIEGWGRRAVAAATIVVGHALALYALVVIGPHVRATMANLPLAVHFIEQPESRPEWKPPPVAVVIPTPLIRTPVLPLIEIPVAAAATDRAITVAVLASPVTRQDAGAPRLISAVEYVRQPSPRYPPQSRRLREQGLVVLRVLIDEQGTARTIEIESSSGHARLDDAARDAVARAVFRPYVEDGAPRRALVLIPIEFALNRSAA